MRLVGDLVPGLGLFCREDFGVEFPEIPLVIAGGSRELGAIGVCGVLGQIFMELSEFLMDSVKSPTSHVSFSTIVLSGLCPLYVWMVSNVTISH